MLLLADHRGVSNAQLAVEDKVLAEKYQNKSVAEQHSLDLSWELFMQPQFEALRGCMFATEADLKRFRQVLVNVVLATDIFDRELNDLRKKRWGKAFSDDAVSDQENNDLRATIVIERKLSPGYHCLASLISVLTFVTSALQRYHPSLRRFAYNATLA